MSGSVPVHWLDRVSEALREHEDRRSSIQSTPPRYEILGEISRGGMGIVYRAWDPQLGRNVALKVLHPEDGRAAEAHERFQREAKLAAGLHHPHIVQVFDTGTWAGQDYIAMQLIEGMTLEQAKPDRKQALTCIRDAARGLHYAHTQGIVHRDVKPGNLLVDGSGRVFVSDFGVARQAVVSATITSPGTVVGTPAYMSPEQALGMPTDARSDVYSLGATLYDLVTGRAPVQGRDAMEVLEAVRLKDPELPTRAAPDLSKNVESIILGAMERCPEDRYATAEELAADIDRYLAGERPLRRPRGISYRVRREFVRHPWRSAAAIALCVLLLGAGVFLGYFIRGYVYLKKGRAEKISLELRKKYFKIAEPWFPLEAGQALEEITRTAAAEEKHRRDLVQEERDRETAKALEDERRKNAEIARKLRETSDESKRKELIRDAYDAVLKALDDRSPKNAQVPLESLKTAALEKYLELLPRVTAAEFNEGVGLLTEPAKKGDINAFTKLYDPLSGSTYQSVPGQKSRLAKTALALAITLKGKDRPREAIHWFDEAESLGEKEGTLFEQRGLIHLELQEWTRAQNDLDGFMRANPGRSEPPAPFAELYYRKGSDALARKDWTEALDLFARTLHINGRHAMAHHDRGIARFRSAVLARDVLEQDLSSALEIKPALIPDPAYRTVALGYSTDLAREFWKAEDAARRQQAWQTALHWLDLIGKKCGENDALRIEAARMQRRLRSYDDALVRLSGVSESSELSRLRGQIRFEKAYEHGANVTLLKEALATFERAIEQDPKDFLAIYWRGTCQHALGDGIKALEDLESARKQGLDSADLYYQLALLRLNSKHFALAIELAGSSLGRSESLTEEGYIANLFAQRGLSRSEGIRLLECDALFVRARAYFDLSEYKPCSADCSRMIVVFPKHYDALVLRADAACKEKRHSDAQKDYSTAISAASTDKERESASKLRTKCMGHPNE